MIIYRWKQSQPADLPCMKKSKLVLLLDGGSQETRAQGIDPSDFYVVVVSWAPIASIASDVRIQGVYRLGFELIWNKKKMIWARNEEAKIGLDELLGAFIWSWYWIMELKAVILEVKTMNFYSVKVDTAPHFENLFWISNLVKSKALI